METAACAIFPTGCRTVVGAQDGPAFVIVVEPDHGHVFGHEDAGAWSVSSAPHAMSSPTETIASKSNLGAATCVEEISDGDRAIAAIPLGVARISSAARARP